MELFVSVFSQFVLVVHGLPANLWREFPSCLSPDGLEYALQNTGVGHMVFEALLSSGLD